MFFKQLYNKKNPSSWIFLKQLREFIFGIIHNNFSRDNGTIWINPHFPSRKTTIYKITRKLKMNLVTEPFTNTKIGIHFHDSTVNNPIQIPRKIDVINKDLYDISKTTVDQIHHTVFGYNTIVDPTVFSGKCVSKSNENALHDGAIISCPIKQKEKGKIYQIIIDNQEEDLFVDYRICVMKSDIVIAYKKFKTEELRFTNDTCKAIIIDTDLIPDNVQKNIVEFTQKMKADFCEIDVLKDNFSGSWYILDLNKTPYGPPASLSKKDKKKAVEILSNGFSKNFLNQ
jgi:hypothetical protein